MIHTREFKNGANLSRGGIVWFLAMVLLALTPLSGFAAEMVTNGTFNTSASWTFATATYDGTNTATADGSGSGTVSASGRNTQVIGTITQTVAIASGSSIASAADVIAAVKHTSTTIASVSRAVTITLRYADTTTVQIFYNNTFADGITWTSIPNQTPTVFPLTLAQNVDQIIITLDTKNGNNASAASQLWADNISINYTAPTTPDTLSVSANTAVAISATAGAANLQMQVLELASSNTDNGNVVINSVTVNDLGTATTGHIDYMKVHIDSDNNFGNGVLGTISTATWAGTSTVVDLTPMAAATRTVTSGTSKYIWITYDLNATIPDSTTIQSSVTAITVEGTDNGASGTWNSNLITVTSGPSATLANCAGCHNYPPVDSASRNATTGDFIGDHDKHNTYTCATCHVTPASETSVDFAHRTGQLNMDSGNIGVGTDNGTYSKGVSFAQSNTPTTGTCSLVDCHNNAVTPQWGVGTTACDSCHGLPPVTDAHSKHYTEKGWATGATTNCTVCHPDNTLGHSDVTDNSVIVIAGLSPSGISPAISCGTTPTGCHIDKATPAWNTTGITCLQCHTLGGASNNPTSGLHFVTPTVSGVMHDDSFGVGGTCTSCHSSLNAQATHANGTFTGNGSVAGDRTAMGLASFYTNGGTDNNGTCATTSCHVTNSDDWAHQWNSAANYYTTNGTACGGCHGDWARSWNTGVVHRTAANAQTAHGDGGTSYQCKECHTLEDPAAVYTFAWGTNDWGGTSSHGNGTIAINSNGTDYKEHGAATPTTDDGLCYSCHTSQDGLHNYLDTGWSLSLLNGTAITVSCGECHTGGVTPGSASGAHTLHNAGTTALVDGGAACTPCHGDNSGTGYHSTLSGTHGNSSVNFVNVTYSTATRNDLTGTCLTASCHNPNTKTDQSTAWNTTALACDDCHYYAATPTSAGNTAHGRPLSTSHNDHFSAGKTCAQCHGTDPVAGDTSHISGVTSLVDKAVATQDEAGISFTGTTTYTFNDTDNTCYTATNSGLGCHATAGAAGSADATRPDWDVAFASTACTSCHTNTSTAGVNPTSGLHGVVPSITAEQHDSSFDGGTGTCASCHTTIPAYSTHKDGVFNGGSGETTQMGLATFYTQSANDTGTCATTACHLGNSDVWAHKWMTPANYTSSTLSCTGCHGNLASGWNTGVDHLTGGIAADHADDGTTSNYGCEACHALQASTNVYPFTFGTADWAPLNAGNKHGNGVITMNDDGTGTITDWQRGTGGNAGKSMCLKCHTTWTDSAPQHWFTDTGWTPEEIAGDGVSAGHGVGAACVSCHDGMTQGTRRNVGLEFDLTRQHGTATPTSADCEKCHDEASGPDGIVQLKVWNSDNSTFTTATYSSTDLGSANTHCLSCHDASRGLTIGGLSAPARSMANYTSTTTYNNHNFTTATGAVVPQRAKAISPHGNPGGNKLKAAADTAVTTAVGCMHCHPSHGSSVASKAATADANGTAMTAKMLGGLPSSLASVGYDYTNEGTLADPNLCWGCHDNKGVADYYGDTTTGHWNTTGVWKSPTFTYKTNKGGVLSVHVADKVDGGTADNTLANVVCTTCHDVHGSPTVAQFYSPALKGKWLTSPYYEDRAPPAKASGTNGLFAWANADSSARSTADALTPRAAIQTGILWAPKEVGGGYGVVGTQNGAWGWFIDGNTFGLSAYQPYTTGAVTQKYFYTIDSTNFTSTGLTNFAGLCMTSCHSAANIEARTTWTGHKPVVPGFGGADAATDLFNVDGTTNPSTTAKVRNQMVGQGWYNNPDYGQRLFATGTGGERQGGDGDTLDARTYSHYKAFSYGVNPTAAGTQANYHQFPCSKCHTPHASVLPVLMRTNCLNTAKSSFEWRMAAEANNCHRVEGTAAYIGAGDPYPGTGYPTTHGGETNGGWNAVTPW